MIFVRDVLPKWNTFAIVMRLAELLQQYGHTKTIHYKKSELKTIVKEVSPGLHMKFILKNFHFLVLTSSFLPLSTML